MPRVLELVTGMFADLGTTAIAAEWRIGARERLLTDDTVAAFVTVGPDDRPIAVAVGVIDQRIPSPRRPTGLIGYVEWLASDPRHRRRGATHLAMSALVDWFDQHSVTTIDVHASPAAQAIYENHGFRPSTATPLRRVRPTT